jgi:hypothetical protein
MAQWAGDKGPGGFYYSTNYLIDGVNTAVGLNYQLEFRCHRKGEVGTIKHEAIRWFKL